MDFYGLLAKIIPGSVWTAEDISEAGALIDRLREANNPAFAATPPVVAETVAAVEATPDATLGKTATTDTTTASTGETTVSVDPTQPTG